MPITIQPPQPGDLITSSFMKQLIEHLQSHETRISALEGVVPGATGTLAINQMDPTDLHFGEELRIFGVNFGVPSENQVTFDNGFAVNQFKTGSNDRMLILNVPVMTLLLDSKLVTVAVSSVRGYDFRQITIRKPEVVVPAGTLAIGMQQFPPGDAQGNISAPGSYVFIFRIDARTTLDETYNVTPQVPQVPQGQTPWQAAMVTGADGSTPLPPLAGGPAAPPWQLVIPKPALGQVSTVVSAFVKVTIPQGTTVANPFVRLDVSSVRNPGQLTGSSGAVAFQLGQPPPQNQTINFGALTATNGSISGTSAFMTVPTNPGSRLSFSIRNLKAGSYSISLAFDGNSNGWSASLVMNQNVTSQPFQMTVDGEHPQQVFISGAAPTGQATLNVTVQTPPAPVALRDAAAFGVYTIVLIKG
jgi:hypothetical protein